MGGYLDVGGSGSYASEEELENDYVRPSDQEAGTIDYIGDVVFVRDDQSADRWDGEEYLEDSTWFDYVWDHGESGEDSKDLPGASLWGNEDSFAEDPSGATEKTVDDAWDFATGDFDVDTPDGSGDGGGDGAPDVPDLPWKYLLAAGGVLAVLFVLAPYAELASKGVEAAG